MEIMEGQLFSESKLEDSKRRITALGYFERVDVSTDGIAIRLRTAGLARVVADLRVVQPEMRELA